MPTTDKVERGIVEQADTEEKPARVVDDVWFYNFHRR
jgi:hypothetical protein